MNIRETEPSFNHVLGLDLECLLIVSELREWKNIAKGTTDPGVDCFDR